MLRFEEIRKEFDPQLSGIVANRSMVKEYLQSKILEFINKSPFKEVLVFIGGTKLRLINGLRRFENFLLNWMLRSMNSETFLMNRRSGY